MTFIKPITDSPLTVGKLTLEQNEIKQFPETCYNGTSFLFPKLWFLSLSDNKIETLPTLVCLRSLKYLKLQNNLLIFNFNNNIPHSLNPFAALTNLTVLNFSQNKIKAISQGTFARLAQLKYLRLSRNQITAITEGVFTGLVQLRYLSLRNNKISVIPAGAFADLIQLEFLNLESNQISVIADGAFDALAVAHSLAADGPHTSVRERQIEIDFGNETTTCTTVPTLKASTCARGLSVSRSVCSMTLNISSFSLWCRWLS
jgi:Leucine-rich repeat (LRR) protein